MRVWFLKQTKSICTESSVGVNTTVWSREGKIYRITPRRNDAVNDTWMSDSGRMVYKIVDSDNRLHDNYRAKSTVVFEEAVDAAVALISEGAVAIVASGKQSVEEQFALKKLAEATQAKVYLTANLDDNDGLLISEDRSPNRRGALLTGLVKDFDSARIEDLGKAIDAGTVKTVICFDDDLCAAGLTEAQQKVARIIYVGTHMVPTSEAAKVVFATRTVFEKAGSFINQNFRLQRFDAAIPGTAGTMDDLEVIATLANRFGAKLDVTLRTLRNAIGAECPLFGNADLNKIPDEGVELTEAVAAFAGTAFPETGSLHYKK